MPDKLLSEGIRDLLVEFRRDLGPYGWTIHVEGFAGRDLSFQFRNRLSSVSHGIGFDPRQGPAEVREELLLNLQAEPEFARTKLAMPPRRKRALVGGLRWAATTYGWSTRVFREIIDTLQAADVLSGDEADWMKIVGPTALQEKLVRPWRKHVKAEQRREQGRERSRRTPQARGGEAASAADIPADSRLQGGMHRGSEFQGR